jgi:predicted outer membrane repeat protein
MKPSIPSFGLLSASLLLLAIALPAKAATISTGAACSLVQAIESANTNAAVGGCAAGAVGRDRIIVTSNVTLSVANNGLNGLPVIIDNLVITTSGPTRIIQRDFTVGTPNFRFLEIGTGAVAASVTISNIYLQNGRVTGAVGPFGLGGAAGGCIFLRNGALKIEDSIVQECVAEGDDNPAGNGASASGGAIYASAGTLEIKNSSFSMNNAYAGDSGAAGFFGGPAEGGAIHASGLTSFTLEGSSLDSNFAVGGAGIGIGGAAKGGAIALYSATGAISDTTFSANAVAGGVASDGDSGQSIGGALSLVAATVTMTGVDLVGNVANGPDSALGRGGYANGGAMHAEGGTVTLEACAVTENRATAGDGSADPSDGQASGGGLYLRDANATLDRVQVESNTVSGAYPAGGGINFTAGNQTDETLLIIHSTVAHNTVTATHAVAQGGGIHQSGDVLTIRNTSVSDNVAGEGAGLFQESGAAKASLSTFSGNIASGNGGAIAADSDFLLAHTIDLANVTISGNSAATGGGLYIKGTPLAPAATIVTLANTIVTNNTNGGIHLVEDHTQPTLESGNSIVGAQASGADCTVTGAVTLTSNGGNLESGTSCAFTHASDRQSVADLGLGTLGANGGETLTHELLADSPAIDSGRKRICNRDANKKDQRGIARFYDGNGDRGFECDSGPAEYQGLLANPGFERPLDPAADWTLVASGGGDGRIFLITAPSGKFALVFQANAALETISQSRPIAGAAGETYTLTLLGQGAGLTVGERMIVTLETLSGGAVVDAATCPTRFRAAAFSGAPATCVLATTGAYDTVRTTIGWDGATTGSVTLDAISLTRG